MAITPEATTRPFVPTTGSGAFVCCGGYAEHFETCWAGALIERAERLQDALDAILMRARSRDLLAALDAEFGCHCDPDRPHDSLCSKKPIDEPSIDRAAACPRCASQGGPPHGPCREHKAEHCSSDFCF